MNAKKSQSSDDKFQNQDFDLFKAIDAIDNKNYEYFSSLTEEQQKKFVPYMLLQWISSVRGKTQLSAYYLLSTDNVANKYMFDDKIQSHTELQWKMLCASSPGLGKQYHQWIPYLNSKIGMLKTSVTIKEISEYFQKIYKNADSDTIKECSHEYVQIQNQQYKLAQLYPDLKLDDIATLTKLVSKEEVKNYEKELGIESK